MGFSMGLNVNNDSTIGLEFLACLLLAPTALAFGDIVKMSKWYCEDFSDIYCFSVNNVLFLYMSICSV